MGRSNKRSRAAKNRESTEKVRSRRRPYHRESFLGVTESSPLKLTSAADQKLRQHRDASASFPSSLFSSSSSSISSSSTSSSSSSSPSSSCSSTSSTSTKSSAFSSSSSVNEGKRGAPRKKLIDLSKQNRTNRLRELEYPDFVINILYGWYGIEYTIRNHQMEVFCFRLNIDDLTSLITYKAQLLPSALQNPVFQTVEALLESFHRIWESRICSGTIAFLDYLASKNVQTNMNTLVRTKTAEETETIGFVRRTANNRVQYNGVFCTILLPQLEVGNVCSYCSTLRKAIKDGKELPHLTSLDLHHSFCNRLTKFDEERIQHWSPFLKEYFREITFRKAKSTKPWPAAILVFSLSMYSRLGEASYEILRASLPLPSISTLNELCFKIPAKPGICYQGIAGFIQAEPYASMSLSFDEIYFTEGLQLIREEHGFRLIGMTSYGCWEKDSSLPSRYFFNFSEETDLIPDIPLDPNISPQPTIGPQLEG